MNRKKANLLLISSNLTKWKNKNCLGKRCVQGFFFFLLHIHIIKFLFPSIKFLITDNGIEDKGEKKGQFFFFFYLVLKNYVTVRKYFL